MILVPQLVMSQPCPYRHTDPCRCPNPPQNCANVPIEGIEYLLTAGVVLGIFVAIRKRKTATEKPAASK